MTTHEKKIEDIVDLLDDIVEKTPKKDNGEKIDRPEWTGAIKNRFAKLGKDYGYQVAPDPCQPNYKARREWLYDLTWWRCQNDIRNNRTSIELAVESEWKRNIENLEIDFLKLVYARAKLKLFIFRARTEEEREQALAKLKELAYMCEDKHNDKYLLACFIEDEGENEEYFIHNRDSSTIEIMVKVLYLRQKK